MFRIQASGLASDWLISSERAPAGKHQFEMFPGRNGKPWKEPIYETETENESFFIEEAKIRNRGWSDE